MKREPAGPAEIIAKEKKELMALPTKFLMHDTGAENRQDAVAALNSFYQDPISDDEPLTVYWLRWGLERTANQQREVDMGELPFSGYYSKLDFEVFPTIRRRDKYGDLHDVVIVMVPVEEEVE